MKNNAEYLDIVGRAKIVYTNITALDVRVIRSESSYGAQTNQRGYAMMNAKVRGSLIRGTGLCPWRKWAGIVKSIGLILAGITIALTLRESSSSTFSIPLTSRAIKAEAQAQEYLDVLNGKVWMRPEGDDRYTEACVVHTKCETVEVVNSKWQPPMLSERK